MKDDNGPKQQKLCYYIKKGPAVLRCFCENLNLKLRMHSKQLKIVLYFFTYTTYSQTDRYPVN